LDQALQSGFEVLADIQQCIKNLQAKKVETDTIINRLMDEKSS